VTATRPYPPSAGFYDEALDPEGEPREAGGAGLALLGDDVAALATGVREALGDRGVSFRSDGGAAEFLLDPVPRVFGAGEWAALEAGLIQRVRALDAFVADVYGPRRAVAEGVVPERLIAGSEGHEPAMHGVRPPGGTWVGIAGLDLVRDAAGELLVLEDDLRTPSGFGYAQLIARPQDYVAQPTIEISLHPTVIGGELQPRHVDLRPFVFLRGHGKAAVMPGGLTRVAFEEGAMVVNSTQNGGAKDTWVLP
jgi:uncharacterized circularly permuted ATP-grasp superfamily protein